MEGIDVTHRCKQQPHSSREQPNDSRQQPHGCRQQPHGNSRFMMVWLLMRAAFFTSSGDEHTESDVDQLSVSNPPEDDEIMPTTTTTTTTTSAPTDDVLAKLNLPRKLPSIIDIKKALPAHCFEPDVRLSIYYMLKDFFMVFVLYWLFDSAWPYLPLPAQVLITPIYWLVSGTFFTAIFVVGHDAGHGSFSNSELINSICGNICHTFLMCPYYMWKLSHRKHHKNTGNIDKDEVYYPVRKADLNSKFLIPYFGFGIGWFAYLIKGYMPRSVKHFNPLDPMFKRHVAHCCLSLACLGAWCSVLAKFQAAYGWGSLVYYWVMPDMVFGTYIVVITFLHHSDDEIPWYGDQLWDNVRGQLSSIDRSYGWCHSIIHNIGTHQIHHLFPKIPHYRLEEATQHFRRAFPKLINVSDEPILQAYVRVFHKYKHQNVIDDDTQVHMYK